MHRGGERKPGRGRLRNAIEFSPFSRAAGERGRGRGGLSGASAMFVVEPGSVGNPNLPQQFWGRWARFTSPEGARPSRGIVRSATAFRPSPRDVPPPCTEGPASPPGPRCHVPPAGRYCRSASVTISDRMPPVVMAYSRSRTLAGSLGARGATTMAPVTASRR